MASRRTASDWAALVDGWKRSGRGGVEFAARVGVSARQLRWWKWRLAKSATPVTPTSAMVRIEVRGAPAAVGATAAIEILRDGWTVRVSGAIDRDSLAQVLDVIAVQPSC